MQFFLCAFSMPWHWRNHISLNMKINNYLESTWTKYSHHDDGSSHIPPQYWKKLVKIHGVRTQKTTIWATCTVETWKLAILNWVSLYIEDPQRTGLVFQKLPKHMRRRVLSRTSKRMPRRLREAHMHQVCFFFIRFSGVVCLLISFSFYPRLTISCVYISCVYISCVYISCVYISCVYIFIYIYISPSTYKKLFLNHLVGFCESWYGCKLD